jgi:two-component sensor histidine kinase/ligand-binding sensor domain-containing protein
LFTLNFQMKKSLILFYLFLLFLTALNPLVAQNASFKFYTPHDGLTQSQVQCIIQDSRGYIWLGTQNGVSYFDGVKFHNLTVRDGFPSPLMINIAEDTDGTMWFTTKNFLCHFDGKNITYDTVPIPNVRATDKNSFAIDKQGNKWLVNYTDYFLYFNKKGEKKWQCVSDELKELQKVSQIHYSKKEDRLTIMLSSNNSTEIQSLDLSNKKLKLLKPAVMAMVSGVNISAGSYDSRMLIYNDSIFAIQKDTLIFKCKGINGLNAATYLGDNTFLMYSFFGKNNSSKMFITQKNNALDSFDIDFGSVNIIFIDKDNNTWLGTEEGLVRFYPKGFYNFPKEKMTAVWNMVEDTEGGMWFGEYFSHKLKRYFKGNLVEKKIDYSIGRNIAKGDFSQQYFGASKDSQGHLYFSNAAGILKYDGTKYGLLGLANQKSPFISLISFMDTSRNIILAGTTTGINVYNLATSEVTYYNFEKDFIKGFILGINKDKNGFYWFINSGCIGIFDLDKGKIIKTFTKEKNSLPNSGSASLFCDTHGTMWAGSMLGLNRYDALKESFVPFAVDTIKSRVNAFTHYDKDNMVVSTKDGLYLIDLQAYYDEGKTVIHHYNQYNGYAGIGPNQNCLYTDSKGNVWVAASDIVTKIVPSELDFKVQPLSVFVTKINGERLTYFDYAHPKNLPKGINTLRINFEAVGMNRPFETEYAYRLVGHKKYGAWSEWQTEDIAIIENLRSGTYTFEVKVKPAGMMSEQDIKINRVIFVVSLPLYQEPYFSLLVLSASIISAGLVGFVFYRRRQKSIVLEKENTLNKHRQLELELLNDEMAHRVKNNLAMMQQLIILQATRTTDESVKKALNDGVDRIQAMSILHDYLVAKNGLEFIEMNGYIKTLCEKVQISYSDEAQNLVYDLQIENLLLSEIFGRHIGLVVSELLTNSLKHAFKNTPEPQVQVKLFSEGDNVILTYSDNGCGIPTSVDISKTKTLGLKLISIVVERFDGTFTMENRNGIYCQINFKQQNSKNGSV